MRPNHKRDESLTFLQINSITIRMKLDVTLRFFNQHELVG